MSVCGFHRTNFVYQLKAVDVENERHYFRIIKPYSKEQLESLTGMFGSWLAFSAEEPYIDFLGDYFQTFVSHGEHGQFFTPDHICHFMNLIVLDCDPESNSEPQSVCDPACGSGRMFIQRGRVRPQDVFFGIDLDRKCALMSVLNLFIRGLQGEIVCGNTLFPSEDHLYDCWHVNTEGLGIVRVPVTESYFYKDFEEMKMEHAEKQAQKQSQKTSKPSSKNGKIPKPEKPKINVGTINLPSENRAKEQVKAVQSGLF